MSRPAESMPASEAQTHLTGEQVFDIAAPYFAWNAERWQEATQGTITMTSLLSFVRAVIDAGPAPVPASEAVGEPVLWYDKNDEAEDIGRLVDDIRMVKITGSTLKFGSFTTPLFAAPAAPTYAKPLTEQQLSDYRARIIADTVEKFASTPTDVGVREDAARWQYVKATTTAIRNHETGEREECTPEQFEASVDRLRSSPQAPKTEGGGE